MRGIAGRGRRLGRDRTAALIAAVACAGSAFALAPTTALARVTPPGAELPPLPAKPSDVIDVARTVTDTVTSAAGSAVQGATDAVGSVADQVGQTTGGTPVPTSTVPDATAVPQKAGDAVRNVTGGGPRDRGSATPAGGGTSTPTREPGSTGRGAKQRAATTTDDAPAHRRASSRRARADAPKARRPAAVPAGTGAAARTSTRPAAQRRPAHPRDTATTRTAIGDVTHAVGTITDRLPDWSRPIIASLLALVLLLGLRAWFNGQRARGLERTRRALSEDIAVLQAALVPALPDRLGGVELSVAYRPADGLAAGGDFYDVFALGEHRTAIILGDVSGHDRQAIARATAARHKLRAYLEYGLDPRMVLHAAGEALAADSHDSEFVTAVVAVHDARDGTLTYACAGHPPPILTGLAAHEPVSACSSAPLGWGLPTGRRQTTVTLADGDSACFFTDGLTEARRDGDFLGREGFERLVAELGPRATAGDLIDGVTKVAQVVGDDLAVLLVRGATTVAAPRVRLEEVELDAADMRRHATERFLSSCHAPAPVIEHLTESALTAIDETGRAVMRVRVDVETGTLDALVEPRPAAPAPAGAVAV